MEKFERDYTCLDFKPRTANIEADPEISTRCRSAGHHQKVDLAYIGVWFDPPLPQDNVDARIEAGRP